MANNEKVMVLDGSYDEVSMDSNVAIDATERNVKPLKKQVNR